MGANQTNVAAQLNALEEMGAPELRALWHQTFGRPHPGWVQKGFLVRALAYHAQEKAYGGLPEPVRRKLLRYAGEIEIKGHIGALNAPRIKPGTRLVREWGGDTHVVTALEKGFEYRDKRFGSLSEIARSITRTRWSGPAFFGLKTPSPGKAAASGSER
jgi:hypothetical protein